MSATTSLPHRGTLTRGQALLLGTITVGVLDFVDTAVFFGFAGATPLGILQFIASGLLGAAAFNGGLRTAALGLLLHFIISLAVVTTYYIASRRFHVLTRRYFICGLIYGLLVYLVMNFGIVPLSAAPPGSAALPAVINGVLAHALLVGLPSALVARAVPPA